MSARNTKHETRNEKPVVFLMGPTASGKTDLALQLAAEFAFEIVSVDSAMVYRGMDIGTAKPAPAVLARAPHRLIDIRDPADTYSAADFAADAGREIAAIHRNQRVPLLVGGTLLYFAALERGLSPLPAADSDIRQQLTQRAADVGWPALHRELAAKDPPSAARIHPNDGQRIQRALEIYLLTGRPASALFEQQPGTPTPWPLIKLALAPAARAQWHTRIGARFQAMLDRGFVGEVEKLRDRPDLSGATPALRAVGYRQIWQYLDGEQNLETAAERSIIATRQLAKRQLTWLRRETQTLWLDSDLPQTGKTAKILLRDRLARQSAC